MKNLESCDGMDECAWNAEKKTCLVGIETNKEVSLYTYDPDLKKRLFLKASQKDDIHDLTDRFILKKKERSYTIASSTNSEKSFLNLPKDGKVFMDPVSKRSRFRIIPEGDNSFTISIDNLFVQYHL